MGQPVTENRNIVRLNRIHSLSAPMSSLWKNSISINSLANNKAPGIDEIPAEVWKSGALNDQLLDVCNMMLEGGEKPELWSKSIITPIPTKGYLSEPQNYRAIGLVPKTVKVCNRMLLDRIRSHFDPLLHTNQNGFRSSRSTVSQILTLRRLVTT